MYSVGISMVERFSTECRTIKIKNDGNYLLQQEILLKGGGENSRQQLDREIIAITVPLEFTIL